MKCQIATCNNQAAHTVSTRTLPEGTASAVKVCDDHKEMLTTGYLSGISMGTKEAKEETPNHQNPLPQKLPICQVANCNNPATLDFEIFAGSESLGTIKVCEDHYGSGKGYITF